MRAAEKLGRFNDPYGNPTTHTGTTDTPLRYTGQYQDPTTGLYYLRARWYDPSTANFLSRDPIDQLTREPYAYAAEDPINGTDPTGLFCGGPIFCPVVHTVQTITDRGAPDYYTVNIGAVSPILAIFGVGAGVNVTVTSSGHIYVGIHSDVGIAGFSGSVRAGWLNQRSDSPGCDVDSFLHGQSRSVSGYWPAYPVPLLAGVGPSGGYTWNSQSGYEAGVGVGLGHDASFSQGYNYRLPFDLW